MSATGNILVIDDEEILRHTLTRVLRRANYAVASAADGHEALRLLAEAPYDLVFLDIRLPGMDGLEILKEIRKRDTQLPVILLTAYGSLQTALQALRLGATDYLLKPIDPEVLLARTRVILEEQVLARRRREIQEKIASLQDELRQLEAGLPADGQAVDITTLPEERFIKRGSFILDLQARRATCRDRVVQLPPAAFDYLVVLTRHTPDIVTYQTLVAEAQGYQADPNEARELAKWHVHALRQAIEGDSAQPRHLINVRGVGYRLVVD
jgi:DNA-binding response OmpR family regulator